VLHKDVTCSMNTAGIYNEFKVNLSRIDFHRQDPLYIAMKVVCGPKQARVATKELRGLSTVISAFHYGLNKIIKVERGVFSHARLNPTPTLIGHITVTQICTGTKHCIAIERLRVTCG
jgi:hypothetical protein